MEKVLILIILLGPVTLARPAEGIVPGNVSGLLEEVLAKHDVPALGGAIVTSEGLEAIGVAGVRRRGDDTPVEVGDRWHLGSCTKAMTATLVARLVERGELAFGDRVVARLGYEADPGWKTATLAHLLTNRAGAPADLNRDGLWTRMWKHPGPPEEARRVLAEGVLSHPPESSPGEAYLYSNAGFSIAGHLAERVREIPFETLLAKEVFEPLGMKETGFGAPGVPGELEEPRGHRADGTPVEPGPRADNPPAISPAGRVNATLADWGRFVSAHLAGARGRDGLLKAETFRILHTPPPDADPAYAMGWIAAERTWGGGTVLTHAGSNTMWFAVVWIAPERDFAVLATTNRGGDGARLAADEVASRLVRRHLATTEPR